MRPKLTYAEVEKFLEEYCTHEPPYDFNGLLHLVLAGIENLRANAIDQDFIDFAHSVSDEQDAFLQRLVDARPQSIAEFEAGP